MNWILAVVAIVGLAVGGVWYVAPEKLGLAPEQRQAERAVDSGGPGARRGRRIVTDVAVVTAPVTVSPPQTEVRSIGTGKAVRAVSVTTEVAGTVEEIHFSPNDAVARSAPLITLERMAQAIALRSAKANFDQQQATFERLNTLASRNSNAISSAQLEEAQATLAVAEADLAAAQFEVDRRVIDAPFDGTLGLSDLEVGDYLALGARVVDIYDTSQLLVEFEVSETAASSVRPGLPLVLVTPSLIGRVFSGRVTAFDAAINADTRTLRVRATVENTDRVLLPGMTFNVSFSSMATPLPVVPAVAIAWSAEGAAVWRVDADNMPERVPLVIRRRDGDRVWIEADLAEGDQIIVDGILKVRPGVPVVDLAAPPAASAAAKGA
ncbi:MAG: efflux RND transporter periplasmic adaptor subunit [Acuticoccus sp.]